MRKISLGKGYKALVDDEDFESLNKWKWHITFNHLNGKPMYAARGITKPKKDLIRMHIQLKGRRPGFEIDHKNGNKLDYRRSNLRFVTRLQNLMNNKPWAKSGYKGVGINNRTKKQWFARIRLNGRYNYLGSFSTKIEAAKAYDIAAKKLFGKFAYLNFPSS